MNKPAQSNNPLIASNKKALHDYFIENRFEAGIVLQGWEVKTIRAGRVQLKDSYILMKKGEAWLIGAHFSPLISASTHINPDPVRSRKLLLHQRELSKLQVAKERQGYAIVALDLHWHNNHVKVQIALAKGKKQYDKRDVAKQKDWDREQRRLLKRK